MNRSNLKRGQEEIGQDGHSHQLGLRPVILFTGGTSGIGLGACQRLLQDLGRPRRDSQTPSFDTTDGVTLILVARTREEGDEAVERLKGTLACRHRRRPCPRFFHGTVITARVCDLGRPRHVRRLALELLHDPLVPYMTHLYLNAVLLLVRGRGIDWWSALGWLLTRPVYMMTCPKYKIQRGMVPAQDHPDWGMMWCVNAFSGCILAKLLEPRLVEAAGAARVIWTTSTEAEIEYHDRDDLACIKTSTPYEASKIQMDLLALAHDDDYRARRLGIESILIDPGVARTTIMRVHPILVLLQTLGFYLCRLLGSRLHCIHPQTSGEVFLSAGFDRLPTAPLDGEEPLPAEHETQSERPHHGPLPTMTCLGARCTLLGRAYVERTSPGRGRPLRASGRLALVSEGRRLIRFCHGEIEELEEARV